MYFQRRPWDPSAWDLSEDIHDRRLMPWDSVTYREHRSGFKRKITSERFRQEETRSALGIQSSEDPFAGRDYRGNRDRIFGRPFPGSSGDRDPREDIDLDEYYTR